MAASLTARQAAEMAARLASLAQASRRPKIVSSERRELAVGELAGKQTSERTNERANDIISRHPAEAAATAKSAAAAGAEASSSNETRKLRREILSLSLSLDERRCFLRALARKQTHSAAAHKYHWLMNFEFRLAAAAPRTRLAGCILVASPLHNNIITTTL